MSDHGFWDDLDRLRAVVENIDEIVYSVNYDDADPIHGRVEFVSGRVKRVIGYQPEEFLRNSDLWFSLLCPEDIPALTESTRQMMSRKQPGLREYRVRHRHSGEYRWMEDRVVPQLDEFGQVRGIVGVARDVTDRKQAEERIRQQAAVLRASEERLRTIFDSEPECVKLLDADGLLLEMNRAGLSMIEADSFDVVANQCVYLLVASSHRDAFRELNERVFRGESGTLELQLVGLKGARRWIETHAAPLHNERGDVISALSISRDITDRKLAEERLRASEERFATIFHGSPVGICITALEDGKFVDANAAFFRTEGLTREDVTGRTSLELGYWPAPSDRERMVQQLIDADSPRECVVPFRRCDGSVGYSMRTMQRITLDGQDCILTLFNDITDRKRTEERLQASERHFRALIENSSEGISLLSADGTILFSTASVARITGFSAGENYGRRFFDLVHPDDQELVQSQLRSLLTGTPMQEPVVFRYQHKDGFWRWLEAIGTNLLSDPSVQAIVANYRDVTERIRAETAKREAELRFRTIFDLAPVGVALIDPVTASVVECNESAARQLGYSQKEFVGLRISDFESRETAEQTQMHVAAVVRLGRDRFETQHRTKSGEIRDVLVTTQMIELAGRPLAHSIFYDITDHKRASEALRQSERFAQGTLDGLSAHIAILDESGVIISVNKAWREFAAANYGTIPNVNEGANYLATCAAAKGPDQDTALAFARGIQDVLARRRAEFSMEYPCHSPNEQRWFIGRVTRFAGDGPTRVVVAHENITDRKQAEQIAHERDRQLSTLISSLPGFAYRCRNNRDYSIDFVSEGITELTGHPTADFLNHIRSFGQLIHPEDQERVWREIQTALRERRPYQFSYRIVTATRDERWVWERGEGVFDANDELRSLEGFVMDITPQKEAELALRSSEERLQTLSRQLMATQETERRQLSYELHDEVGQVLTAINLKLHSLKSCCDRELQAEFEEGLSLVENAVKQVRDISLNLRPPMLDVLGLEAAVRWCLNQHAERMGWDVHLRLQLETRLPPDLEITCFRVVQSAVTNVARHARATEVVVEIHQSDLELELLVRDNGVGLDSGHVQQRLKQGGSFGILAMRERVELAGGTFCIESAPQLRSGTSIRASFPLAATAESGTVPA